MTKSKLLLLAATCVATLSSCGDSDTATAPGGGASAPFATAAVGTWTANKALEIVQNGLEGSATAVVVTTIRPDSTFSGSLGLKNLDVSKNPFGDVEGDLYTRSGTWRTLGDSVLLLSPSTCTQSRSATVPLIGTAPFGFNSAYALVANPHDSVACGLPDTLRTKPVGDSWLVPYQANLPAPIGSATWTLDFRR